MNELVSLISKEVNIPSEVISEALSAFSYNYKKFKIPKRSGGGLRTIIQPSSELKLVQHWLTLRLLSKLPVHSSATAFQPRSSILNNALSHRANQYAVRVDFKDFFPSIQFKDLARVIQSSKDEGIRWAQSDSSLKLIRADLPRFLGPIVT